MFDSSFFFKKGGIFMVSLWHKHIAPQFIFIHISDHFSNHKSEKFRNIGKQIWNIDKIYIVVLSENRNFKIVISQKFRNHKITKTTNYLGLQSEISHLTTSNCYIAALPIMPHGQLNESCRYGSLWEYPPLRPTSQNY